MIRGYINENGRLRATEQVLQRLDAVVWIDLVAPDQEEEAALEAALGIDIPTREEMGEIEISSRLYHADGAAFMTAILPVQSEGAALQVSPVTFVLAGPRLITVRYHEPRAFRTFPQRAEKVPMGCVDGETTLVALLEAIVDRLADVLERVGDDVDDISRSVFQRRAARPADGRDFQNVLEDIGRQGDLTSNVRHSLVTFDRLVGFLGSVSVQRASERDVRGRLKTLARDVRSLADHAAFLSQKITFLLDATLGMISIEQSAIIKIFSVAAVAFLPPTLIASIYGMNFKYMPELDWPWGYPLALAVMVASAALPYWYFKRRGWL